MQQQRLHSEEPTPMPDPDKPFTHPKQKEQRDPRKPPGDAPGDDTPGEDPALWEGDVRLDSPHSRLAQNDG